MACERLQRSFYARPVLELARALLGTRLVHERGEGAASGIIVEVEAYHGPEDRAAHSFGGRRTARTRVMYARGGYAYVYQIYGMHFCFNVVAAGEGQPQAVLVRALEPLSGVALMAGRRGVTLAAEDEGWLGERRDAAVTDRPARRPSLRLRRLTDGPAKLCAALGIDRRQYGLDLAGGPLHLCRDGSPVPARAVATGPRVNVDYAGPWARKPWRMWIRGNPFVSR